MSTPQNTSLSPSIPQSAHSPRSPLLAHFEKPPDEPSEEHLEDYQDDDGIPYLEPGSEQTLLPPPDFRPFFTLIEDSTTGEHYHPYVHYVFADDDPVLVTAASMRSLGLDDTKFLPQDAPEYEEAQQDNAHMEGSIEHSSDESPLPPSIPGVKEHYVIIDLGSDGKTILDAKSLSPEWQITESNVRTAPSFDETSADQGYMLRVQGLEIVGKLKGKAKGHPNDKLADARERNQGDVFGALDSLVGDVEKGLALATKLVGKRSAEQQDTVVDVRITEEGSSVSDQG